MNPLAKTVYASFVPFYDFGLRMSAIPIVCADTMLTMARIYGSGVQWSVPVFLLPHSRASPA